MNLTDFLMALQTSAFGSLIRGDSGWGWLFPIVETIHVIFLSLVFGSIAMVDLRLLGLTSRGTSVSKLSAEVLPWTWTAFAVAAVTGTIMFVAKADTYFHSTQFDFKFLCMFLAGINMVIFHFGAYRHVLEWDNSLPTPPAARVAGVLSIALWVGVIFFGRWIGFTT